MPLFDYSKKKSIFKLLVENDILSIPENKKDSLFNKIFYRIHIPRTEYP